MLKEELIKQTSFGLSILRSMNFAGQSALLPLIDRWVAGNKDATSAQFKENIKRTLPKVQALLKLDAENIADGVYPMSVLFEESPLQHYRRLPWLIGDAVRALRQKKNKETSVFEGSDNEFVGETPDYYHRNFHFQKGGYLSDTSAQLYDHQVEILFSGTGQAMRRQMIPRMKRHFKNSDGEGLKFLEVGSGTGALTRAVALAFPKAQITCVDISPHYLKLAQSKLAKFKRISFLQGKAEDLMFKDETFDAVFSCYLFHELPQNIRRDVVKEKWRVLKSGGFFAIADSIQRDDDPDMNWALEQFPINFHEPFYTNYVKNSLEHLLETSGIRDVASEAHFFTKIVSAAKPV